MGFNPSDAICGGKLNRRIPSSTPEGVGIQSKFSPLISLTENVLAMVKFLQKDRM